jgi:peptidoglycan/xylan/chitin deacetylase (PgdA/CDA1 family)
MYHRIADAEWDPWDIKVSASSFEKQIKYISEHHDPVSLISLTNDPGAVKTPVVLSFDDGYLDNYTIAKPILEKYGVPATFFITTSRIGKIEGFWWDRLCHIFLEKESLHRNHQITIDGKIIFFDLDADAHLSQIQLDSLKFWKAKQSQPNKRVETFFIIWRALKFSTAGDQEQVIEELENWSGAPQYNSPVMNWDQVREISDNMLFNIGAHSVNHSLLDQLEDSVQSQEIIGSQSMISEQIGKQVNTFAAPFGGYNSKTLQIIKNAGFDFAVTTQQESATLKSILKNPLEIPRIQVIDNTDITKIFY